MLKFAENVTFIRKNKNVSKKEMAKLLEINYSTYCNYEYGNREPSLSELVRISTLLNISTDLLLYGVLESN